MSSFNPTQKVCLYIALLLPLYGAIPNATAANGGTVSLAWDANTETNLAGYKLYMGTQSRVYSSTTNIGNRTSYQVTGLTPGATYYFALSALNTLGRESGLTPEITYLVPQAPTNAPPTLNPIAAVTVGEDSGARVVALSGISAGSSDVQTLTVTAASSNPSLIPQPTVSYSSPSSTGSITLQPQANASGTATITVTVNDGQLQTSQSFAVTVQSVNDPPYFDPIANMTLDPSMTQYQVQLVGIQSGAPNESNPLSITATSSRTDLIPTPTVTYTSPSSSGIVTLRPVAGATGTATIAVTVNDGQAQNGTFTRTFTVTLESYNTPPTISQIPDLSMPKNRPSAPIPFTVNDDETAAADLQVTADSSDTTIVPQNGLTLGGTGANRTVVVDPTNGRAGNTTITVTVDDGSATASTSFDVNVQ